MKIILLKDVAKVGKRYEIKDISDGYAVNLLIPNGLAISATPNALKRIEMEKAKEDTEQKVNMELLIKNLNDLENITLTIVGKANEKGHLFAGLHREEIAKELQRQTRLQINPSSINLKHPIKEAGEHTIEVKEAGKSVKFRLYVQSFSS
ncbi:MAG TPA: 50S ribosomal protein L9 [Candidatus Paceibacterota bacterium]